MTNKTLWDRDKSYGDYFYKMAIGETDEMFSSIALTEQIRKIYKPQMKVLDVGCGAGHYLRSLRSRLNENINYLGIDATPYYIELAQKAYQNSNIFKIGSIFDLPMGKNEFDIVMCNNVILHLASPAIKALSELIRVSDKYVVVRTIFGKRNYSIQELRSEDEITKNGNIEVYNDKNEPIISNYFNIYTKEYFEYLLHKIDANLSIQFINDRSFSDFDNTQKTTNTGTQVINGMQISGNIVLDWKFVIIEKRVPIE
jgi:ubiquinone/menaquinone biosynthesis C-methylase UbiE